MKRSSAILISVVALAGAALFALVGAGLGSPTTSPPVPSTASPTAVAPTSTPAPTPTPRPTPTPSPTPVPSISAAIVPVTQFRTPYAETSAEEVAAVLAGTSKRYAVLVLVAADAEAILRVVGATAPTAPTDPAAVTLVLLPDAGALRADLVAHRDRLAIVRATDVDVSIRALAWEGVALFGVDRVTVLADWPLFAAFDPVLDTKGIPDPGAVANATFSPDGLWTMVAGGDILLDRGVAKTVKIDRKGVDFPFDGGTAEITSRYCCSSFGWELPRTKRTGNEGAMRAYLQGADLAIANFENPAPVAFRFHPSDTVFTADPALIEGLVNAGIDYVSLANNHIRDAGGQGILDTIRHLDEWKIAHGGAGKDLTAARAPTLLEANGTTVAILGRDAIAASYAATATRAGSAPLQAAAIKADIAAARAAGADVVIVFPHWGTEYDPTPFKSQRTLAHAIIDAGADMVIGNHAHWAAALEVYDGRPIWYALGNFVFDQTWSEPTMEGITLELTFDRATLVQARMRPHIILDKAQPNFMDPAGSGKVVMNQVFAASKGLLPW